MAASNRLAWASLGAWLVTLADLMPRLGDSAFEPFLTVLSVLGAAGAVVWLRGWSRWAALGAAAAYLLYYVVWLYRVEVEPLLAIMSFPDAVADALYVLWSSPMGRMSRGEVFDGIRQLWRE